MGKSVSWLCASPESASSGSPVSDRQTQRQAQAGGGGGREEGERGELEDCKVRGAQRNETQSQRRNGEVESRFLTVLSQFLFSLGSSLFLSLSSLCSSVCPFSPGLPPRSSHIHSSLAECFSLRLLV